MKRPPHPMITATIILGGLLVMAVYESLRPRRRPEFPTARRRAGNLGVWLFNATIAASLFASPASSPIWPRGLAGAVAAFLALDLLSYLIHRAQHAIPLLWHLHALHHSDPDVDFSTAVRHHPAEHLLASAAFWGVILALGIPARVAAMHGATVFILSVATHMNARWPRWIERLLQPIVVTLDLHLIHHSIAREDQDRNFGAALSVWDRLFDTFARPSDGKLTFGVAELSRRDACRPVSMLLTPWRLQNAAQRAEHQN